MLQTLDILPVIRLRIVALATVQVLGTILVAAHLALTADRIQEALQLNDGDRRSDLKAKAKER